MFGFSIVGCTFKAKSITIFKYCYIPSQFSKVKNSMKEVKVEVIGTEPPCMRCQATRKAVEKAAEKLKQAGVMVNIEKANIMSKEIVQKYGVLVSPAIAINNTVKIMGRVPSPEEVEKLIMEAAK
jgi:protein-disulfide isomerase